MADIPRSTCTGIRRLTCQRTGFRSRSLYKGRHTHIFQNRSTDKGDSTLLWHFHCPLVAQDTDRCRCRDQRPACKDREVCSPWGSRDTCTDRLFDRGLGEMDRSRTRTCTGRCPRQRSVGSCTPRSKDTCKSVLLHRRLFPLDSTRDLLQQPL